MNITSAKGQGLGNWVHTGKGPSNALGEIFGTKSA